MASLPSVQFPSHSVLVHPRLDSAGRDAPSVFSNPSKAWTSFPSSTVTSTSTGGLNSNSVGHNSRLAIRASASSLPSSGQVSVATKSAEAKEREELKGKLLAAIDAADGNLNEECVSIITELSKLNPNRGLLEGNEGRKLWVGAFEGIKASFKGTGKKGGGKGEVGFKGAPATLGRLSFNGFKPADLDVYFSEFLSEVCEDPEGGYVLIIGFTFDNPRIKDLPPVDGMIFIKGSYTNVGPDKQEVVFQSSCMRPRFPEKDLEVWKEVFAEQNGGMDEIGQVFATFSNSKGSLEYLYIDEELRITKGNFGAYVVVRRLAELPPEFIL
ncbi:unnamed protein product [Calypogeia fissa]